MTVGLLAVYTLVFRVRPASDWTAGARAAADRLEAAATKAVTKRGRAATKPAAAVQASQQPGAVEEKKETSPDVPKEPLVWGSDPFVRNWVMLDELAELSLRAITLGGAKAYALINDQILEEGDQIGGKRIVKIESEKVILEQGGRTFNLLLGE